MVLITGIDLNYFCSAAAQQMQKLNLPIIEHGTNRAAMSGPERAPDRARWGREYLAFRMETSLYFRFWFVYGRLNFVFSNHEKQCGF
jgi:hypothetical protein